MPKIKPIVQIRRLPFCRADIVRQSQGEGQCHNCGRTECIVYQYGTQSDGLTSRVHWLKHHFCGISCCEAYHGEFPKG